jgi:Dolichyl-phosphate-mannose-protein mannosyltransferase
MTLDTRLQGLIHSLEQGGLAGLFRRVLLAAIIVGIALAYLLIQFNGLSSAQGMDQAQIARQLALGHGFSTKLIRPLALAEYERANSKVTDSLPDSYHAPLGPSVNAVALTIFRGALTAPLDINHPIFAADRVIAALATIFLVLSLIVTYSIGCRLFDSRVALISCALVLLSDQFWQFSLSGLPQMLILFLFSCAAWCLVAATQITETPKTLHFCSARNLPGTDGARSCRHSLDRSRSAPVLCAPFPIPYQECSDPARHWRQDNAGKPVSHPFWADNDSIWGGIRSCPLEPA